MSNFSKIALGSSLVLGAVLFSVGCGGNSMCCKDKGEPPIPKIADAGSVGVAYSDGQYTLSDGNYKLKLNGLDRSVDTDNGQVVKCNWYIADEDQDLNAKNKKLVVKDQCQNVEFDFSKYANGTKKLVCLEVIDNNGLSSKLNNGGITDFNADGVIRKNGGAIEDRKRLDCRRVVVAKTPEPSPLNPTFEIYNARTNGKASVDRVKQGCPFYFKPTTQLPSDATCKWTIDGVDAGSNCDGVTGQHKDDLNKHKICLSVNGGAKECKDFQAVEHSAPTPVLGVYSDEALTQPITGNLNTEQQIYLSCKDSKNDCPGDNAGLECKWDASSYDAVNGSCDVPESSRNYNFQDCFNNPNHTGHGPQTTSANGDLSLTNITYQYVCGSAADKCVEIKLKVTDKRYTPNKTSQTLIRHFKVNP